LHSGDQTLAHAIVLSKSSTASAKTIIRKSHYLDVLTAVASVAVLECFRESEREIAGLAGFAFVARLTARPIMSAATSDNTIYLKPVYR
jgi:hypothetical protein